jgi:hypothetical protein
MPKILKDSCNAKLYCIICVTNFVLSGSESLINLLSQDIWQGDDHVLSYLFCPPNTPYFLLLLFGFFSEMIL